MVPHSRIDCANSCASMGSSSARMTTLVEPCILAARNDFADEVVGLVYGCVDPGDDYVLDLAAECDLDVQSELHECPECDGEGCGPGDPDCRDGKRRSHGRASTARTPTTEPRCYPRFGKPTSLK